MSLCPCSSQKAYKNCCGPFLEQKQLPQTPEQLMRSRYTAYSLARIDYIKKTMKDNALIGFDELIAEKWAKSITWLDLKVILAQPTDSDIGFVEFIARFIEQDQIKKIHETSEFQKENGCWFYVNGINQQESLKATKIARNNPCPCGSGKKFKNCHARISI